MDVYRDVEGCTAAACIFKQADMRLFTHTNQVEDLINENRDQEGDRDGD